MATRRHKGDTKTFAELTYEEQAKSITASINNLQNAIVHHIQHAPARRRSETKAKCLGQVTRFLGRLVDKTRDA